jgi:hypothetical protein
MPLSRILHPRPGTCTPATPKQTLIIAPNFASIALLLLVLVIWYYRCCCCCCFCCFSREGDSRGFWERLDNGVKGWEPGGVRSRVTGVDEESKVQDFKDGKI